MTYHELCATYTRDFGGRIVLLGFGTIGRCLLPMLLSSLPLPAERYRVVDGEESESGARACRQRAVRYEVRRIVRGGVDAALAGIGDSGDLILNLTVGVDSVDVADWCHRNGVGYVDSSIEPWEDAVLDSAIPVHARTEYAFHQRARRHAAERWRPDGPTAVFCHGANPGLVSHFVKAALVDVAEALGHGSTAPVSRADWATLARATGVRVIHVSERDTQVPATPKRPDEFVNTWSIPGLVEEASMPVELGWGTHECNLPPHAYRHRDGPGNAIYCAVPAARVLLRSWVPLGGQFDGLALPHSEAITISDYFTVVEEGAVAYRPTVAFVYLPCDAAMASLHETVMRDWRMQSRSRVVTEEVLHGRDELGVLLLGHGLTGWWYGSQLDVAESRRLVPESNPTAIQVSAGVLAAAAWTVANPKSGFREAEDLPHDQVLALARPWLGPMVSRATDWTPLKHRNPLFESERGGSADPWQYSNFLVS